MGKYDVCLVKRFFYADFFQHFEHAALFHELLSPHYAVGCYSNKSVSLVQLGKVISGIFTRQFRQHLTSFIYGTFQLAPGLVDVRVSVLLRVESQAEGRKKKERWSVLAKNLLTHEQSQEISYLAE